MFCGDQSLTLELRMSSPIFRSLIYLMLSTMLFASAVTTSELWAQTPAQGGDQTAPAASTAPQVHTAPDAETEKATIKQQSDILPVVKTPVAISEIQKEAKTQTQPKKKKSKKGFWEKILPILLLLAVVSLILSRLPTPNFEGQDISWRSKQFRVRRVMNWLSLGLTYAFLYMGRYNLKVSKFAFENMKGADQEVMMSNEAFGIIFAAGTVVYGFSFLINGPLTDKLGGRFAILLGGFGACIANALMGLCAYTLLNKGILSDQIASNFVVVFSVLYGLNMYFQSFGAVAIVKVNASWFHLKERGVFGAIFGILISLGIYLAFDIGYLILGDLGLEYVFFIPTLLLALFFIINMMVVRNTPGEAGLVDFDTADASSGDDGVERSAFEVFKMMLTNPIIITIALVEFCSGFVRQAPMQWYRTFAKQTDVNLHLAGDFVYDNWGMLLCIAGILGGLVAGVISDRVFQSRRGPVAAILYGGITIGSIALLAFYDTPAITFLGAKLSVPGILAIVISTFVIGVHGMLSGTASMDFGGRKNVGIAVGIIDGFVYLGTAVMSITYANILPREQLDETGRLIGAATVPSNWVGWPISMIIVGVIGTLLASRVWHARPKVK
jgi:MFS transporter, OPA family, glycerol-3-phosphate transporter